MTIRAGAMAMTAVAIAAGAAVARADTLRVLMLVSGDRDRELAARVEGQTADLDVAIATADAALPSDLGGQLAAARARAAASGAGVVVWFSADGGDRIVHVVRGERMLVRRVGAISGALSASATVEAVALVVRTAVRGLAAGGEIGVEENAAPAAGDHRAPTRPWAELGWAGALDGESSAGLHGVFASLGWAWGRWRIGATFTYHPATILRSPQATIEVQRQAVGAMVGVDLLDTSTADARWRAGAELNAAAARFLRSTTATSAGLTPTSARNPWTPVVTPAVRVAGRLAPGTWLAFTLGADLLLRRPEFVVAEASGSERVAAPWPIEPRATLSLVIDPM